MSLILIVEDSVGIAECLKDALEMAGHTVYVAGTMRGAMDSLERLPVEAVISDGLIPSYEISHPPVAWGPEITAFCRKTGIRAVLYSADDELVEAERRAGGVALLKPAGLNQILDALERDPVRR